ncbi:glycosyl hydrolase [Mucidula mucida]|nr:glycosyl hydrolase [Mucidula mucida]
MHTAIFLIALLASFANAYPNPLPMKGDITSPQGGSPTLSCIAGGVGIPYYTSTDMVTWNSTGRVWPDGGASWTDEYSGGPNRKLWAPDCTVLDGVIHLFYCASTIGSQHSAIFYATSDTGGVGSWTNGGLVVSTNDGDDRNAIDPNFSIDPVHYLTFGSYWTGIYGVQLDPTTMMPRVNATTDHLAQRTNGALPAAQPAAEEAPVLFKYADWWYLFTSWNSDNEYYQTRVTRSSTYNSGYVDSNGTAALRNGGDVILTRHDSILGPGGEDTFVNTDDYKTGSPGSLAFHIGLNRMDMSSGWPVLVNTSTP